MERRYKELNPSTKNRGRKYVNSIIKTGTTIATVTGTALTIYSNADKIRKLVKKMSDYKIIHDDELMHYGVPGMRWGHRKAQIMNTLQRTKRVGSQIGKDVGSAAKNKYNNMSSKGQKRLKIAGRVALAFTPVGITGQLAAHGVKKYAQKHPEKIQNGKNKVNNMKNMSVAQARKYADMWNQK